MVELSAQPELSRRERKKERTRGEIYDAAMRLFARNGFDGVTIAEICEEADVGRGTFFLHFPHKASLLHEFNARVAEDFRADRDARRGTAPISARAELQALVESMASALESQREIMAAMLAEYFSTPAVVSAPTLEGDALPTLVTRIIEAGQARGEFSASVDARLAAASFFGTAAAILSGRVFAPDEISPQEVRRQFLRLMFQGLAPASD